MEIASANGIPWKSVLGAARFTLETEPEEPDANAGTPETAEGDEAFRAALARIRAHDYDAAVQLLDKAVLKKTAFMARVRTGAFRARSRRVRQY
jgi:hypothetical protein